MKKIYNNYKLISKTTKIHILLLTFFCLLQVILITKFQYVFGSNVDWMKQHIVFPNYFRNLFYETGNLLPDFAFHLGGGQNIFYFAYYGLLSPIILFSYLLSFISMGNYIMVSSIVSIIVSVILFYYFLRRNNFNNNICFVTSLLFLSSSSFIFHSHRHIMFVSYMPFLILGLIGVYRYFEKRKSGLLIINIFLMILTSYYYSVAGLITICLYGLYYYLKKYPKKDIKCFFKNLCLFLFRILVGILLATILLLPVIYVILNGRTTNNITFNISHFLPLVDIENLMYGTYSVGLTSILWISLVYSFIYLKKEYKIISLMLAIITIIPIFNLLLNGGLYINGKVFVPLMPLFLFLIASMIKDIKNSEKSLKWLVLGLILSVIFIKKNSRELYFFIEIIITLITLFLFRKKKKYYYFIPILIISFIVSYNNNINDDLVSISDYQKQSTYLSYDILDYINQNTDSIYRYQDDVSLANGMNFSYGKNDYRTTLYSSTANLNYVNSFYNTFNNNDIYRNCFMLSQTNNLFFNRFMGIRYFLTNSDSFYGYNKIKEYEYGTLYENKNVYPIGFSSSHLLNVDEYNELSFIEKLFAYQNNIIIDGKSSNKVLKNDFIEVDLDFIIKEKKNVEIEKNDDHYIVDSENNGKVLLELDKPINDKTLIIRFKMNDIPSCKNGDTYITINGIMNKLTCRSWKYYNANETFDYVLSSNLSIGKLDIEFGRGSYDISNIEVYEVDNSYFDVSDITPLLIDFDKTKDNVVSGNIEQKDDGYFIFTIPYDEGFKVFVDSKQIDIEKVNDSFIGFYLSKGNHDIRLEFKAPYFDIGKIITLISGFIFLGVIIYEKKHSD